MPIQPWSSDRLRPGRYYCWSVVKEGESEMETVDFDTLEQARAFVLKRPDAGNITRRDNIWWNNDLEVWEWDSIDEG